jgi:cyanophycinase
MDNNGVLALVGGAEWTPGCSFDADLLAASGGTDVLILPTAAAYQHPERVVLQAAEWFAPLEAKVEGLMVLDRTSADDPAMAAVVRKARFIYLAGGSPLHLKAVLKKSATFEALRQAWSEGAVVAGSGAGAMVLTDPMVDPRGGALTLGLGLIDQMAVMAEYVAEDQKVERTVAMAPKGLPVVGLPERTALIREVGGTWRHAGHRSPVVFLNGDETEGLAALK